MEEIKRRLTRLESSVDLLWDTVRLAERPGEPPPIYIKLMRIGSRRLIWRAIGLWWTLRKAG